MDSFPTTRQLLDALKETKQIAEFEDKVIFNGLGELAMDGLTYDQLRNKLNSLRNNGVKYTSKLVTGEFYIKLHNKFIISIEKDQYGELGLTLMETNSLSNQDALTTAKALTYCSAYVDKNAIKISNEDKFIINFKNAHLIPASLVDIDHRLYLVASEGDAVSLTPPVWKLIDTDTGKVMASSSKGAADLAKKFYKKQPNKDLINIGGTWSSLHAYAAEEY